MRRAAVILFLLFVCLIPLAFSAQTPPTRHRPSIAAWPGQSGNPVGFAAYGDGVLGTTAGGSIVSGTSGTHQVYTKKKFTNVGTISASFVDFIQCDFDSGASSFVIVTGDNVTFNGSRFQSNEVGTGAAVNVQTSGANITFSYSSFTPLASLYTSPPGAAWPSAGARTNNGLQTENTNSIGGTSGYQFALHIPSGGPVTVDHCDMWGYGNAINFTNTTAQINITNNWIHDTVYPATMGYHSDGPGYLNGGVGPNNILIQGNTIASLGNTNAIAFQGNTSGQDNIQVIGNYLSGFGYTIRLCANGGVCTNSSFKNNVFSTDIVDLFPAYPGWIGQVWKCNTLLFAAGTTWSTSTQVGTAVDPSPIFAAWTPTSGMNGQFLLPGSTPNSATDFGGNVTCPQ